MDCLAETGSESGPIVIAAVFLVALGVGVYFWARHSRKGAVATLGAALLLMGVVGGLGLASAPPAQAACSVPVASTATPTASPTALPVPDFTPAVTLSSDTTAPTGTVTATIRLDELLNVPSNGPITVSVEYPSFATATFAGTNWTVISDDGAGTAELQYTATLGAGSSTPPLTVALVQNSPTVTATGTVTATILDTSGGDSNSANNVAAAQYIITAP